MLNFRSKSKSKALKISDRKTDEFLSTILCIFTMAKWFGIPTYGGPFFLWFAVVMLLMLAALEAGAIWKLIRLLTGIATNVTDGRGFVARLSGTIFYGNAVLSLILSWRIIASWKLISFHWARAESGEGLFFPPDLRIRKRVIFVTVLVGVCACVEHMMSMISATGIDIPPAEYFHRYILSSHGFLLQPSEYSLWLAIPIFVLSKMATILWNFQDLIIILISMGLASRYHRLNLYVIHVVNTQKGCSRSNKLNPDFYGQVLVWRRLREAYVRQAALVRRVDRQLGTLVLLSNFNNFYFICLQLFLGINNHQSGVANRVYYLYSTGWLLFRACSVVLAAADVNVHSKRALKILYACPSATYNVEIKRLKNQLTHDCVFLSGMGFFALDRYLLLEVAAAILKYELVMIQYDH